jgi:hypothetical protein
MEEKGRIEEDDENDKVGEASREREREAIRVRDGLRVKMEKD